MRIKILVSVIAILTLGIIIYLEHSSKPYNNIAPVTNNTEISNVNAHEIKPLKAILVPNFDIKIIGKTNIKQFNDIKAKKIVIHFWASWCNICTSEFKDMITYSKQNPDTTIVAISIDDNRDKLGLFLDELNRQYDIKSINNLLFSWDQDKSLSLDIFGTEIVPENYIAYHDDGGYNVSHKLTGKANWHNILKST